MVKEWPIYSKDGETIRAITKKLTYNGTYMADRSLTVTIKSPVPIDFKIGDTISYRGDEFALTYIPASTRQARSESVSDAIVYEGIVFKSTIRELEDTMFTDYVQNDNLVHYTGLSSFSFYVANITSFANRIQACLDNAFGSGVWTVEIGNIATINKEKEMTIQSGTSIFNALAQFNNEFAVNFTIRGRKITIGHQQDSVGYSFLYGKGNGLKKLTQIVNTEQKIVTKLRAYGSTKNIPYRFYNDYYKRKYPELWNATLHPEMYKAGRHILDSKYFPNLMLPYPVWSEHPWDAFILSEKLSEYGSKDGEVKFDGSDSDWEEIFPTLKGIKVSDLSRISGYAGSNTYQNSGEIDRMLSVVAVTDNGVSADGKYEDGSHDTDGHAMTVQCKVTIPNIGFNLWDNRVEGETPTVVMDDGMCAGREFEVLSVVPNDPIRNGYVLTLQRVYDDAVNMMYPNSTFGIAAGDHFHLTGIKMDDVYVEAAEYRLLDQARAWLAEHDHTFYTYQPEIDNIWMAEHEEISNTITEGMKFMFTDEELGIHEGSVTISQLVIKEGEGDDNDYIIPQYEVALSDDIEATLIEKVDTKIREYNADFSNSFASLQQQVRAMYQQFLSKINDDTAAGKIRFLKGLVSVLDAEFGAYHREHAYEGDALDTGAAVKADGTGDFINLIVRGLVKGTLNVEELLKVKDLIFSHELKSQGARQGFLDGTGIYMNADDGLIEADGMNIRGFLRVMELVINRLQLMESDYSFTEGGTVEHVDISDNGQRMIFTMHKEHDNDFTPFYEGDILYAKVNDLLPRGSVIPDGHTTTKDGSYFTSWVYVESVDLENNTLTVVPYVGRMNDGTPMVPGSLNFTPKGTPIATEFATALQTDAANYPDGYDVQMNVTRHGNIANSSDPLIKQSQLGRQQSWVLSTTDKRLSFFWNVDKPIIEDYNYALCLGILPDLANLPSTRNPNMPSLYVNTIFYDHQHAANYPARIVKEDRGQWVLPDSIVPQPTAEYNNTVIYDPYHYKTYTKATWLRYRNDEAWAGLSDQDLHQKMMTEWKVDLEISRVWHNGILWECLVDGTTQEPCWGCTDWQAIGGNTIYTGEITTSNGRTFRNGNVDTILTMRVWYGDEEITSQVLDAADYSIVWKRSTGYNAATEEFVQTSEDLSWVAKKVGSDGQPAGQNVKTNRIKIDRNDMGSGWMISYRQALISSTVTFSSDGQVVTMPADYVF